MEGRGISIRKWTSIGNSNWIHRNGNSNSISISISIVVAAKTSLLCSCLYYLRLCLCGLDLLVRNGPSATRFHSHWDRRNRLPHTVVTLLVSNVRRREAAKTRSPSKVKSSSMTTAWQLLELQLQMES